MELIGKNVRHAKFGDGIIKSVSDRSIDVDFKGEVRSFAIKVFSEKFVIEDENARVSISEMEQRIREQEEAEEAAKAAHRAAEKDSKAAEENRGRRNTNRAERDEHSFERLSDGRMYFIVFQSDTFDVESNGNYLWAPTSDMRGVWCHHWQRIIQVRENDVIFHCCGGEICAVSVASASCYNHVAPNDPVYSSRWGQTGMRLDTSYVLIPNSIRTRNYRTQIMATYPEGSLYAPFDRNGDGNQGYLYELDVDLANIFLNDIMSKNPGWQF